MDTITSFAFNNYFRKVKKIAFNSIFFAILLTGCTNPQPGPDKTIGGTVVGSGIGAGAGAIIGNQVATAGAGAAAGAGIGAAAGLFQGATFDQVESNLIKQQKHLNLLEARTKANLKELQFLQETLDNLISYGSFGGIYQVFFDEDSTTLKSGAISNLQVVADGLKVNPSAAMIYVVGHSDDTGRSDHNKSLAEARAREVVSYLSARGISVDQIKMSHFGSERPIASNSTPQGRQLNRRVDIYYGG